MKGLKSYAYHLARFNHYMALMNSYQMVMFRIALFIVYFKIVIDRRNLEKI